jgi:hypothetical protein
MVMFSAESSALVSRLLNDKTLEQLELYCAVLFDTQDGSERFLNAFQNNKSIKRLQVGSIFYDSRHGLIGSQSREDNLQFLESVSQLVQLQELTIRGCFPWGDISTQLLAPMISPHLTHLSLGSCLKLATADQVASLADAIAGHEQLRQIKLRGIRIYAYDANMDDTIPRLDPLVHALASIPTLEDLELHCHISLNYNYHHPVLGNDSLTSLCRQANLQCLELSNLRLDCRHLETIAQSVNHRQHQNLKKLVIEEYRCTVGESDTTRGLESILQLLEHSCLLTLVVKNDTHGDDYKALSPSTFDIVRRLLEKNYHVRKLDVDVTKVQKEVIALYLRLNRAGRQLLQEPNASKGEWIRIMDHVKDDSSALFCILRECPELCGMVPEIYEVACAPAYNKTHRK